MKAKQRIETLLNGLFVLIESLCKLMLLFMACTVTAQVIVRACGSNIRWCEEIMLFLLDGLMFLLLPIGIKDDLHIRVEVLAKLFPKKFRKALVYISDLIILVVSICMVYYGRILMTKTFSKLNVTGIPKKYLYLFTVISGVLCAIVIVAKLCGLFRSQATEEYIQAGDKAIAAEKEGA